MAMFSNCYNLTTVQNLNVDNITRCQTMFFNCSNLVVAPNLNTSHVFSMYYMYRGCTNLTTVPIYDMSNVSDVTDMFTDCSLLTNESLDNILYMFSTSKITSGKLKSAGLSQDQTNICVNLPNWANAQAAGWTTGY